MLLAPFPIPQARTVQADHLRPYGCGKSVKQASHEPYESLVSVHGAILRV